MYRVSDEAFASTQSVRLIEDSVDRPSGFNSDFRELVVRRGCAAACRECHHSKVEFGVTRQDRIIDSACVQATRLLPRGFRIGDGIGRNIGVSVDTRGLRPLAQDRVPHDGGDTIDGFGRHTREIIRTRLPSAAGEMQVVQFGDAVRTRSDDRQRESADRPSPSWDL